MRTIVLCAFLSLLPCAAHSIHYVGIKDFSSTFYYSVLSLISHHAVICIELIITFRLFNKLFSWPKLPHLSAPNDKCFLTPALRTLANLLFRLIIHYVFSPYMLFSDSQHIHTAQIFVIMNWAFRKHQTCQTILLTRPLTWRLPWLSHCGSLLGFYFSIIPSPQFDMTG